MSAVETNPQCSDGEREGHRLLVKTKTWCLIRQINVVTIMNSNNSNELEKNCSSEVFAHIYMLTWIGNIYALFFSLTF